MNIQDLITQTIKSELSETRVALPGTVISFDSAKMTVDVQPNIKTMILGEEYEMAQLVDVPVMIPSAGGFSMTFPISAGDECIVIFSDKTIDAWAKDGGSQHQTEQRSHHISDGLAIIGLRSQQRQISAFSTRAYNGSAMEIRPDSGSSRITFLADGNIELHSDVGIKVVDSQVTVEDGHIACTNCDLDVTGGDVTADGISLKDHTHPQGSDSNGDSQVDTGKAK